MANLIVGARKPDGIRHAEQYFGVWAMAGFQFSGLLSDYSRLDLQSHSEWAKSPEAQAILSDELAGFDYQTSDDGVAVLSIEGPMLKYGSSFGDLATVAVRRALRNAAKDPDVKSILIRIDSPGGTVSGTDDLANDVAEVNKTKPVVAYIEDMGASAAYWVASQASAVYANPTALVGSIGTYSVVYDHSREMKNKGIDTLFFTTGRYKGAGAYGVELTASHKEEFQATVDSLNEQFIAAIARGRGMSVDAVRELATGKIWIGKDAAAVGLVDGVASLDAALGIAASGKVERKKYRSEIEVIPGGESAARVDDTPPHVSGRNPEGKGEHLMPDEKEKVESAPTNESGGVPVQESETKAEATQEETKEEPKEETAPDTAELDALREENAALQSELESLKATVEDLQARLDVGGVAPMKTSGSAAELSTDPVSAWESAVAEMVSRGASKSEAVRKVALAQPELRAAYVAAYNSR